MVTCAYKPWTTLSLHRAMLRSDRGDFAACYRCKSYCHVQSPELNSLYRTGNKHHKNYNVMQINGVYLIITSVSYANATQDCSMLSPMNLGFLGMCAQ